MATMEKNNGSPYRPRLVAALDIGTAKVGCLIAEIKGNGNIVVKGMGHRVSRGIKQGVIVDLDQAASSVCAAVDQAEKVAGQPIEQVIVNLSSGAPKSRILSTKVALNGTGVLQTHIDKALGEANQRIDLGKEALVHAFPACYGLDGALAVNEPLGMFGQNLSVTLHAVIAAPGPIRNIETCVQRSHLDVSRLVLTPYASGLSVLVDDERELGSACIDMGAGTTSISIFVRGRMVHSEILPIGGDEITQSIATGLLTPISQAERLKILNGSAYFTRSDEQEIIEIPKLGSGDEGDRMQIPRAVLTRAIEPHMERLFVTIRKHLEAAGFGGPQAQRVVLTGGASQLTGVRDYAEKVLGKKVRLGRPENLDGLPEAAYSPPFATLVGLLQYVVKAPAEAGEMRISGYAAEAGMGKIARLGNWLKANF